MLLPRGSHYFQFLIPGSLFLVPPQIPIYTANLPAIQDLILPPTIPKVNTDSPT